MSTPKEAQTCYPRASTLTSVSGTLQDDPEAVKEAGVGSEPRMHTLSGNQPLFNHDKTKSLSINGEIYNYKKIREELKDKTPWRTASDCESVIHAYEEVLNPRP